MPAPTTAYPNARRGIAICRVLVLAQLVLVEWIIFGFAVDKAAGAPAFAAALVWLVQSGIALLVLEAFRAVFDTADATARAAGFLANAMPAPAERAADAPTSPAPVLSPLRTPAIEDEFEKWRKKADGSPR